MHQSPPALPAAVYPSTTGQSTRRRQPHPGPWVL